MIKKVRVYGSGFSGLATAACLHWHGVDVEICSDNGLGGILQTSQSPYGGVYEAAAVGLVRTHLTRKLLKFAKVEEALPVARVSKKFIYNKTPSRWPLNVRQTLGAIPSFLQMAMKKSSLKPRAGETLEAWGERVFGEEFSRRLLEVGFQGIYGGDSAHLSARLVTKNLFGGRQFKAIKTKGTITSYPAGGMQNFLEQLKAALMGAGVRFRTIKLEGKISNEGVDAVALCVGLKTFCSLNLEGTSWQEYADKMRTVPRLDLGSSYVVAKRAGSNFEGYGCLFPRDSGFKALGLQLDPGLFRSSRQGLHFHRFIYGCQKGFDLRNHSIEDVEEAAKSDFEKLYGEEAVFEHQETKIWRSCLPFYGLQLEEALGSVPETSTELMVCGNFLGTVGLSDILERSYLWAKQLT